MLWFISFITGGTLLSKAARLTLGALAILGGIWGYGLQKKHEGKVELRQESKVEAKKLNEASKKARDRITTDDKYFERRLSKWCRDCK